MAPTETDHALNRGGGHEVIGQPARDGVPGAGSLGDETASALLLVLSRLKLTV